MNIPSRTSNAKFLDKGLRAFPLKLAAKPHIQNFGVGMTEVFGNIIL